VTRTLASAALLIALSAAEFGHAQEPGAEAFEIRKVERLHLDDVHAGADRERVADLYLRALTRYGEPVEHLRPGDLEIREDGHRVDPEDVSIEPLSATGRGLTVTLAIDASRTMKGEPFERAREAAAAFLERLESRDRVAVVAFGEVVDVVAPFESSRAEAGVRLRGLELDPNALRTVLYDGAHRAVELIRQGSGLPRRAIVVLFSDGKDGGSNRSLEQVIELAKGGERDSRILVFTIGYARFGGGGLDVLRRLAAETGGEFLQAASMVHLKDFYDGIARQMLFSYVVRFPSDMDGEAHRIEVTIEGQKDARVAFYPAIAGPWWPYLLALVLLVLLGLVLFLMLGRRAPGRLVFVSGPVAGTEVPLRRGRTRIGALPENDVSIPSSAVSRYHAEIHVRGSRVEIEDLRSRNGTEVNGRRVQTHALKRGDRIGIADVELVYER
jgi:VWFA-related protein